MNTATDTKPEGPTTAWADVQHIPGLTYRRFDHWCTKGYIDGGDNIPGQGIPRTITADEVAVVTRMAALVAAGILPVVAVRVAREMACGISGSLGTFRIVAVTDSAL